jgi:antitoxin component YwqK of YwqJK toxin-antitoxin module
MPLKEKNNMTKALYSVATIFALCVLAACGNQQKQLSDQEQQALDSLSKLEQKRKVDSMKRKNPLLILPPDSNYTGSYVDKYQTGITKFVGFYRQGKRHGQWMSFFPNGMAWSEMHYDKGLRQGPNLVYYNNGKMRFSGFYKGDRQDSVWTYYDSLGKVNKKLIFKADRIIKEFDMK